MKEKAAQIHSVALYSPNQEIAVFVESQSHIDGLASEFSWDRVFKRGRNHIIFDNGTYVNLFARQDVLLNKICGKRFDKIFYLFEPNEQEIHELNTRIRPTNTKWYSNLLTKQKSATTN